MAKTLSNKQEEKVNKIIECLKNFKEESSIYYATETFLKEGLGIVIKSANPNTAKNNYFIDKEADYQYVQKALANIKTIMPMGIISKDTLKKKDASPSFSDRYEAFKIYALEANDSFCRDDIAALTRAFNRIDSVPDKDNNTKNCPVLVLFRQESYLSIAICERSPKNDCQDTVGKVIILHNILCDNPRKGHVQILENVAKGIKLCISFDELYDKLISSLSIDIVSDNFFDGYIKLFKKIEEYATKDKRIRNEFLNYSKPEKAIRDYVKLLMGRLVFIQFLQRKGWMGVPADDETWTKGEPEFVQNLFHKAKKKSSFINDVLNPLFRNLNTKRVNDIASHEFEDGIKIPYLNGGLFDNEEYYKIKFALPEELTREMLEFFRSYYFTIDENAKDSIEIGVDPEMLSRIFESLLETEDKEETGAYYTPKEIVEYMCREALVNYLQSSTEDDDKRMLYRKFVESPCIEGLDSDTIKYLEDKLQNVKICDPAIGSGAFPMGMLKLLFDCRKCIEEHTKDTFDPLELKKDIIQNSIYGVDIEKGAVDIARLRFWLALIIDEKTPHALPNMDFKIMQGNSLLEKYEDVDLSGMSLNELTKKNTKKGKAWQASFAFDEKISLENINHAIHEYYLTDNHDKKVGLRGIINDNIRSYIVNLRGCTAGIQKKISNLPIPNDQFFLWHIYFKEVFDNGGFDIVIGNPPYVNLQTLKDMSRVYEKCNFKTYDKSADLYCLFTEHGFNILKSGGTLCYIMSNKWMKADYGKNLRNYLLGKDIKNVVDFGDIQVFKNATTYPCIILLNNNEGGGSFKATKLREYDLDSISSLSDEFSTADLVDDIWLVTSRKAYELYKKLKGKFNVLRDFLSEPSKYGIKPGLTKAFLINRDKRDELVGLDNSADDILVPFLSGKDISPYKSANPSRYIVLLRKGDTLKMMGRDTATEEEAWAFIKSKYPSVCNWLSLFEEEARKRKDQGDFWWELRACTYYNKFAEPKIMYQTFQVKPDYIFDTKGSFCNNSMWILPTDNKALLGLFNSKIGWWLTSNYCTEIQSGYQLIWDYFNRIPIALGKDEEAKITELVDKILSAREKDNDADISEYEHEIDCCLYELYGLTNGEVKIIDPEIETFGADFELYERKPDFNIVSDEYIERVYTELRDRFNKISEIRDIEDSDSTISYALDRNDKPHKEELEDAFIKWNCGILTSYRGSKNLSREKNLERNERRNEELKANLHNAGLLFRSVDGYYIEVLEGDNGNKKIPVNELSFFVTNTDFTGKERIDRSDEKEFFRKLYRLAEHYEQDSFLFTFPGNNRVAFLVATNNAARNYFSNDIKFAGPLYNGIDELDAWTGCADNGKLAFQLKGLVPKKIPHTKFFVAEGDLFDTDSYAPDYIVAIHDNNNYDYINGCINYRGEHDNLNEVVLDKESLSEEDIQHVVEDTLNKISGKKKVVGFNCSLSYQNSYVSGAKIAFETAYKWYESNKNKIDKFFIVDIFGHYYKLLK